MCWQSKKFPGHPRAGVPWHSGTLARLFALPLPWRWTEPPLPDPNRSLAEKRQHGAAVEPSPTQTSASTQGWTTWHQVHGKAGGRTVPSYWVRACSTDRWGISIKEGNSLLYKCSAVQNTGCKTTVALFDLIQNQMLQLKGPLCPALFSSELEYIAPSSSFFLLFVGWLVLLLLFWFFFCLFACLFVGFFVGFLLVCWFCFWW